EASQERACEAAEALLRRYGLVAMMQEVRYLPLHAFIVRQVGHVADVMVRADEGDMVGVGEKAAHGFDLGSAGVLAGAERVEADDEARTGGTERRRVGLGARAVIGPPLDFGHRTASLPAGLFDERGEVFLHDVIKKAGDALVEARRIRERLESRIEHPPTFEE